MNKEAFLKALRKKLSGLPQQDIQDRLDFYSEIIDDRVDEGYTQEEAVSALGDINDIAEQIIADTPFKKIVKEKITPKKSLPAWEIVLLILGAPIWLSLLISIFAIALSLYVSLWAVVISLWAITVALAVMAPCSIFICILMICQGNLPVGLGILSAGLVCAGLSIFMFMGCLAATKGIIWLIKHIFSSIKRRIYHA